MLWIRGDDAGDGDAGGGDDGDGDAGDGDDDDAGGDDGDGDGGGGGGDGDDDGGDGDDGDDSVVGTEMGHLYRNSTIDVVPMQLNPMLDPVDMAKYGGNNTVDV